MKYLTLFLLMLVSLVSCKVKTVYVPVENTQIKYQDRWHKDSIYLNDSVFVLQKNDTIWIEKYKTIYRERLIRDSVYRIDSVQVPYPVIEVKEVNRLNSLQAFQVWCGRILIVLLLAYFGWKLLRRVRK